MGESSTRRDPSLFEHEAIELPSSTAPATLETRKPMPPISSSEEATTIQIHREIGPKWDTVENSFMANLTTTALGILRGAGSDEILTRQVPYVKGPTYVLFIRINWPSRLMRMS